MISLNITDPSLPKYKWNVAVTLLVHWSKTAFLPGYYFSRLMNDVTNLVLKILQQNSAASSKYCDCTNLTQNAVVLADFTWWFYLENEKINIKAGELIRSNYPPKSLFIHVPNYWVSLDIYANTWINNFVAKMPYEIVRI